MKLALACALVSVAAAAGPAAAKPQDPKAAITALIKKQVGSLEAMVDDESLLPAGVYADGAQFSVKTDGYDTGKADAVQLGDFVLGPCGNHSHTMKDVRVQVAADQQAAVVSFSVHFELKCDVSGEYFDADERASEIVVKTKDGWRVADGLWSAPIANKPVNDAAIAGKLSGLDTVADTDGDATIKAAVDALVANGVDAAAAARKELIAIGSGPKELTTTGAAFARPWKAAWVGRSLVNGRVRAQIAPSGTTAWAVANIVLKKTKGDQSYEIPFRTFLVFDKSGDTWSLIHVHFAVPSP